MKVQNFSIGDKVLVLDDNLEGIITAVNKFVISMEDNDGFIHQYQPQELILLSKDHLLDKMNFTIKIPIKNTHTPKIQTSKKIRNQNNILKEVDLHIHEITDSNKNMSNFEMLSKQLQKAKIELELAINNKMKRIVFIHGVGQGVLKEELMVLFKKYPVEINDANYKKYGKGATELTIFTGNVNKIFTG